jgi:hypothetical protein
LAPNPYKILGHSVMALHLHLLLNHELIFAYIFLIGVVLIRPMFL